MFLYAVHVNTYTCAHYSDFTIASYEPFVMNLCDTGLPFKVMGISIIFILGIIQLKLWSLYFYIVNMWWWSLKIMSFKVNGCLICIIMIAIFWSLSFTAIFTEGLAFHPVFPFKSKFCLKSLLNSLFRTKANLTFPNSKVWKRTV